MSCLKCLSILLAFLIYICMCNSTFVIFRETFTIFSGGMPTEKGAKSNCITVMVGKTTTVLEMEHTVVDFITLCENPWTSGNIPFVLDSY